MNVIELVVTLIIGLALGAAVVAVVLRSRERTVRERAERAEQDVATARAELVSHREVADRAREESNSLRVELQQSMLRVEEARSSVAEAERRAAEARQETAEARTAASEVREKLSEIGAQVAQARAERDSARARAEEVVADRERMSEQFKIMSAELLELQSKRADEAAEKRLQATDQALKPVTEALQRFQERLNDVEKERVAMSRDLQAHVQTVRSTGDELRRETASLVSALRQPHVRGAWGEMQLRRVAEVAGMLEYCDFDLQVSATTTEGQLRPDMRVNLAGGKFVYVDAKVPLAAFLDAQEATDDRDRDEAMVRFGKHLKTHIDQLSSKQYWTLDVASPEFVVMFLASDAFLQAGLEQMPNLHEYAAARNVVVATPAILIATLRSIAYGWKQSALADSAAEVFTLGRDLYDRLSTMGGHFKKLGKQLGVAVESYNKTVGSLESRVLPQARRFKELKISDGDLNAPELQDEVVRSLSSPELLSSAEAELEGAAELQVEERLEVEEVTEVTIETADTPVLEGAKGAELPEAEELTRPEPALNELPADGEGEDSVPPPIPLEWRRATMGR
ncbi:DNA recombination protein RmuC [Enemella sp. A6]|uniref:DNA recombination protein RmuC n=1 Tax=Enemella sp. A6 TaxID=3440152 RepID=UPI003EBED452